MSDSAITHRPGCRLADSIFPLSARCWCGSCALEFCVAPQDWPQVAVLRGGGYHVWHADCHRRDRSRKLQEWLHPGTDRQRDADLYLHLRGLFLLLLGAPGLAGARHSLSVITTHGIIIGDSQPSAVTHRPCRCHADCLCLARNLLGRAECCEGILP